MSFGRVNLISVMLAATCLMSGCERPKPASPEASTPKPAPPLPVATATPGPSGPTVFDISRMLLTTETETLITEAVAHVSEAVDAPAGAEVPIPIRVAIIKDALTSLTAGLLNDATLNEQQREVARAFAETSKFVDRARLENVETREQFDALIGHVSEALKELQIRLVEAVEAP